MTPQDLRTLRTRAGYTQRSLAAALGVSEWTVQRWEAGTVPIRRIHALAVHGLLTAPAPGPGFPAPEEGERGP